MSEKTGSYAVPHASNRSDEVAVVALTARETPERGVKPAIPSSTVSQKMVCTVCNWVYDPAMGEPNQGVAVGTCWSDISATFLCPECGLGKEVFEPVRGV